MPTMDVMITEVEDKICELMSYFEEKVGNGPCKYELNFPNEIRFDLKGASAGISSFNYINGSGYINFNPILMEENWDHFIEDTVIHEVSHYCVSLYVGYITTRSGRISHHGKDWKGMMRFFGKNDTNRCHNYNITSTQKNRKIKRFHYSCDCGYDHTFSTTFHNKFQKNGSFKVCKFCRSYFEYTGKMTINGKPS